MHRVSQKAQDIVKKWVGEKDPLTKRYKSDKIDQKQWNRYRSKIEDLYIGQGKTQHEVDRYMRDRYAFRASKPQYTHQFKKWRLKKLERSTDDEWQSSSQCRSPGATSDGYYSSPAPNNSFQSQSTEPNSFHTNQLPAPHSLSEAVDWGNTPMLPDQQPLASERVSSSDKLQHADRARSSITSRVLGEMVNDLNDRPLGDLVSMMADVDFQPTSNTINQWSRRDIPLSNSMQQQANTVCLLQEVLGAEEAEELNEELMSLAKAEIVAGHASRSDTLLVESIQVLSTCVDVQHSSRGTFGLTSQAASQARAALWELFRRYCTTWSEHPFDDSASKAFLLARVSTFSDLLEYASLSERLCKQSQTIVLSQPQEQVGNFLCQVMLQKERNNRLFRPPWRTMTAPSMSCVTLVEDTSTMKEYIPNKTVTDVWGLMLWCRDKMSQSKFSAFTNKACQAFDQITNDARTSDLDIRSFKRALLRCFLSLEYRRLVVMNKKSLERDDRRAMRVFNRAGSELALFAYDFISIIARLVSPRRSGRAVVRPVVKVAELQLERLAKFCKSSSSTDSRIRAALAERWAETHMKGLGGRRCNSWDDPHFGRHVHDYIRNLVIDQLSAESTDVNAEAAVSAPKTDTFGYDFPLAGSVCSSHASDDWKQFKSSAKRFSESSDNGITGPRTSPKKKRKNTMGSTSGNRWSASTYSTKADSQMSLTAPTDKALQDWAKIGPSFLASHWHIDEQNEPIEEWKENIDPGY